MLFKVKVKKISIDEIVMNVTALPSHQIRYIIFQQSDPISQGILDARYPVSYIFTLAKQIYEHHVQKYIIHGKTMGIELEYVMAGLGLAPLMPK
jgi:hypothetical protein